MLESLIQDILRKQGQVLSLAGNPYGAFQYDKEIIIDNNMKRFIRKTGSWNGNETEHNGRYQMNYYQNSTRKGSFGFCPWIEADGQYEISIWYPAKHEYSQEVTVQVTHHQGSDRIKVNQQRDGGQWIKLGTYTLSRGFSEVVTIHAEQADGIVVADAVKLTRMD